MPRLSGGERGREHVRVLRCGGSSSSASSFCWRVCARRGAIRPATFIRFVCVYARVDRKRGVLFVFVVAELVCVDVREDVVAIVMAYSCVKYLCVCVFVDCSQTIVRMREMCLDFEKRFVVVGLVLNSDHCIFVVQVRAALLCDTLKLRIYSNICSLHAYHKEPFCCAIP